MPDLWLVRTVSNQITGPHATADIREMIEQRKLNLRDEVCRANDRWIYLYQTHEIHNFFGTTLTEEAAEDPTRISLDETPHESGSGITLQEPASDSLPDLPELEEFEGTDTALVRSRAFRQIKGKDSIETKPFQAAPEIAGGRVEKLVLWRILTWLLFAGMTVLVIVLIQMVRK